MEATLPGLVLLAGAISLLVAGTRMALARPESTGRAGRYQDGGSGPRTRAGKIAAAIIAPVLIAAGMGAVLTLLSLLHRDALVWMFAVLVSLNIFTVAYWCRGPARIAVAVALAAIPIAWLIYPGWLTTDLAAVLCLAGLLIGTASEAADRLGRRMAFVAIAGAGVIISLAYDAVQVSLTHTMTTVANHAISAQIPMLLTVPATAALHSAPAVAVGLGDIAIPAVLVIIAGRCGYRTGCPALYTAAVAGFAAGLAAAFAASVLTASGVPATVFTIPATAGAVYLAAARHGLRRELHRTAPVSDPVDTTASADVSVAL